MIKDITEKEIEDFDDLLRSFGDAFPDLEYIDGLLCAMNFSPEMVSVSAILSEIMDDDFEFKNEDQAKEFMRLLLTYNNSVITELTNQPKDLGDPYCPYCLKEDDNGNADAMFWANGFMHGVSLFPEIWEKITDDEVSMQLLAPMIALAGQNHPVPELRAKKILKKDFEKFIEAMFQNVSISFDFITGKASRTKKGFTSPIEPITPNQKIIH
jgi:uncharacterized protein